MAEEEGEIMRSAGAALHEGVGTEEVATGHSLALPAARLLQNPPPR